LASFLLAPNLSCSEFVLQAVVDDEKMVFCFTVKIDKA
jgi:hypothetical protein